MARNYYYLVAGLRQYAIDTDAKGFDAVALRDDISGQLHGDDREYLREFYTFYDLANIVARWNGKTTFDPLGNFTPEELDEELRTPENLSPYIAEIVRARKNRVKAEKYADREESATDRDFERALRDGFYEQCGRSGNGFIRKWYAFDRQLRNIAAATTARRIGREIEPELVGQDDINSALAHHSSADFGLKAEIDYIDALIQILENKNIVEKERGLDRLRWEKADEFTELDYFDMNRILAYCAKIDIIHRWIALDERIGNELFLRLVDELTVVPGVTAGLKAEK